MGPNRDLGPCMALYDNTDLGKTLGGVKFMYTEESKPVNEDQAGVTNVDEIKVGVSGCSAEVPLSRTSLAILAKVIGGSTYSTTTLKVKNNQVGVSMYDNAKVLILKPIVDGVASTNAAEWLTIGKAYPRVDMEVIFDRENQRVYKVIFKAFPDAGNANQLFKIGT